MSDRESSRQNERLEDATPTVLELVEYPLPLPTIPNVPFTLRKGKEKYFEPIMFSFGPVHRGKFSGGENMKLKLASHFIRQNSIEKAELWKDIVWNLDYLMIKYYGQRLENKPLKEKEDLARVFFVDGCAVLHFIYCITQNKLEALHIQEDEVAFAQRDLFLLENQLPYDFLELLIDKTKEEQDYRDAIAKFVQMNLMVMFKGREKSAKGTSSLGGKFVVNIEAEDSPYHLLDLLHKQFLVNMKDKNGVSGTLFARIGNKLPKCMQKIVEFYVGEKCEMGSMPTESFSYGLLNRSVKELKASGIKLRPREEISLCHITFEGRFGLGTLKLPRLVVDDSTTLKLFNLIAYEMCPSVLNDFVVISYVRFLASIIDEPKDVRELRKANILVNLLDSDKIIANLFNDISRNLTYYPDIHKDVKQQIEDHCNSMVTTWTSQLLQKYFDGPWAGLAFLGALLGLTLGFIQTYYTVRPEWW